MRLDPRGWGVGLGDHVLACMATCPCELGNCVPELAASCVLVARVGLRVRGAPSICCVFRSASGLRVEIAAYCECVF
eukprot:1338813-Alexandrium_andersonii.AAC.1